MVRLETSIAGAVIVLTAPASLRRPVAWEESVIALLLSLADNTIRVVPNAISGILVGLAVLVCHCLRFHAASLASPVDHV